MAQLVYVHEVVQLAVHKRRNLYDGNTVPTTKLRTPPSIYVYSYGATCLIATRITFERLGIKFFFFFWRPEEKLIYKSYTLDIFVGRTPKSLHPRLPIKNTLLSCHKRRVKTGFFKNR
jgi:hypothetical protein